MSYASMVDIKFFDADFQQKIVDDKGKILHYSGHIKATKPHYVLWNYKKPIQKDIYISENEIIIIEPEIEQIIVRKMNPDFNFFKMIQNAKKIKKETYTTTFNNSKLTIHMTKAKLISISYKDKFENNVSIVFSKQIQNKKIPLSIFTPKIPLDYDLIRD